MPTGIRARLRHPLYLASRRRLTRCLSDWSSDVCSSDLCAAMNTPPIVGPAIGGVFMAAPWFTRDIFLAAAISAAIFAVADRKSVVWGKSVDLGGRRIIKKKNSASLKWRSMALKLYTYT